MKRRNVLVAVVLLAVAGGVVALYRSGVFKPADPEPAAKPLAPVKEPTPPQSGTPIDEATVEAWKKAGFEPTYHTLRMDEKLPELKHDRDGVGDAELATVPEVRVPFTLYLGRREFTDAGLPHLARHPYLAGLDLNFSGVTDAGLGHLAALKSLRALDLKYTAVTTAGILKHLPRFAHLTALKLDAKHLTDATLAAFAEHGLLRLLVNRSRNPLGESFVTLNLNDAPITDEGLKHFATITDLTDLYLQRTDVRGDGLKHLKPLRNLTRLQVSRRGKKAEESEFTDEMLRGLVEADLLHAGYLGDGPIAASGASSKRPTRPEEITGLGLNYTQISDEGLKYLAGLTNLHGLDLKGTRVTGTGFKHLAGLKELTRLNLNASQITEEGLKHVGRLENLVTLFVDGRPITSRGVQHLAPLKKLRRLVVSPQAVTDEVLAALVETGLLRALTGGERDTSRYWGVEAYYRGWGYFPKELDEIVKLNLIDSRVTDEGLKPLAKLKNLQQLRLGSHEEYVRKGDAELTGAGLKHLAGLESLTHLVLEGPQITNESMKGVAHLKNLKSLDLYFFTRVTLDGLKHLAPLKETLTELDFFTNFSEPTEEFKAELKKILPKCKIINL